MKYEDLMEYSKESLINTILDYQNQLIEIKKQFQKVENLNDLNYDRFIKTSNRFDRMVSLINEMMQISEE